MTPGERIGVPEEARTWKAPDDAEAGEQETRDVTSEHNREAQDRARELHENDIVVSDTGIDPAKHILTERGIPFQHRQYSERILMDAATETAVPGEYVLTILDPENPEQPAPAAVVETAVRALQDESIAVRYGKRPGNTPPE
jgi:hypothetical protein